MDNLPPREVVLMRTHPLMGVPRRLCKHWDLKQPLPSWKVKTATCCCFNLHFSGCHLSSTIFPILFGHFYLFFRKLLILFFLPIFFIFWLTKVSLPYIRHKILGLICTQEIVSAFRFLLFKTAVTYVQKF